MSDQLIVSLKTDADFQKFLEDSFDPKQHATKAIQTHAISQQLAKLAEGINLLDKEIHSQVAAHHDDLLSQASGIETLEGVLLMMQTRSQSLLAAVERIRNKVHEPYTKILQRTTQLRRLQEACDLLRHIIRIKYLSKRLEIQLQGGHREITKAAQSLNELDYLSDGVDLTGIDVVEADRRFIKHARKEVETQAQKMLEQGMQSQNQTQVATALQVFHNLGNLATVVRAVMEHLQVSLQQAVRSSLDVAAICNQTSKTSGPGRAAMPAMGNTAHFRAALWTSMEKLMDIIFTTCAQAQHLQKILVKKRDPITHIMFIKDLAEGEEVNLMFSFWNCMTQMLKIQFEQASDGSTFIKQTFEGEYPKLLRLFNELWHRLRQYHLDVGTHGGEVKILEQLTPGLEEGAGDELGEVQEVFEQLSTRDKRIDSEHALKSALANFEQAYLSRSLSRLFDPINLMFTAGSLSCPTPTDVETIVKTISSELNVASVDSRLCVTVAKNVAKTVQLYGVKAEQLLATGGEASQVIGPPTEGQTRNATMVNSLYLLHQSVSKVLESFADFPDAALFSIKHALEGLVILMGNAIQPLLSSIADALEAIILTMHNEDFSQSSVGTQTEAQCSLFMRELQEFTTRVASTYLSQFQCSDFIMESMKPVACQSIELFVRHASLLRSLGDGGKMRLAADFAQMELAVVPLCKKVADLGNSYRLLRAFRPLLFQTIEHVVSSPAIGDIIPHSTILHYLFSRAPPELKPPHEASKWSLSRYTQWLDDHPNEKDRLMFIKGSLESYVQGVRQRQGTEFASCYPLMLDLLQQGLQHHSSAAS